METLEWEPESFDLDKMAVEEASSLPPSTRSTNAGSDAENVASQDTVDLPCLVPCAAAWLVHGSAGDRFAIPEGGVFIVGRSPRCSMRLDDNLTVSREHVLIRCENGACFATDLGSRNGTFVDGARLEPGRETPVPFGANVRLGGEFFWLRDGKCPDCVKDESLVSEDIESSLAGSGAHARGGSSDYSIGTGSYSWRQPASHGR